MQTSVKPERKYPIALGKVMCFMILHMHGLSHYHCNSNIGCCLYYRWEPGV
jgi:hypothetical protein